MSKTKSISIMKLGNDITYTSKFPSFIQKYLERHSMSNQEQPQPFFQAISHILQYALLIPSDYQKNLYYKSN
jgi:hypothetical protein